MGNFTNKISDHLHQFLIATDIISNPPSTKSNIFERDWSKFDQENFILNYLLVDWENLIKSGNRHVDKSFMNFLTKFNSILDIHAPLKKAFQAKTKVQK